LRLGKQATRALQFGVHSNFEEFKAEIDSLMNVELERVYQDLQVANEEKSKLQSQLRQLSEELDRQTREDTLTGICNRRFLEEQISLEFSRARRFKRDLTVVMAEIDKFELITDQFSKQVGDEVIKTVARILRESCRVIDFVARYGGYKFAMLLIETPVHKARMFCEKTRVAIEQFDWAKIDPHLHVTISLGLTDDFSMDEPSAMLPEADTMLNEAKREGGNQIASQ
jgi:diguanylate cyclase (GGDEF)-like protein